jgi:hypothetical protein
VVFEEALDGGLKVNAGSKDAPIALPDGRRLVVLRDAANYITASPKRNPLPEWQPAIEALIRAPRLTAPIAV